MLMSGYKSVQSGQHLFDVVVHIRTISPVSLLTITEAHSNGKPETFQHAPASIAGSL
jgi:hypothetical protein